MLVHKLLAVSHYPPWADFYFRIWGLGFFRETVNGKRETDCFCE